METSSNVEENQRRFLDLLSSVNRDGISELEEWLQQKTDFFTAPASSKFHGAYKGGLCQHSLNVYDECKRLLSVYPEIDISEESVVISTLLHDLCKANFYAIEQRNRKNEAGQWEKYDFYTIKEQFCFGGHGSKSVYLAQHFIKLTPVEAVSINSHMGNWDGNEYVGKAYEQFPFAWLLHVADESAMYIKEGGN